MLFHSARATAWAGAVVCAAFAVSVHAAAPNLARPGFVRDATPPQPQPALSTAPNVSSLDEGFDDITTLAANGWFLQNSSSPVGVTNWFQGTNVGAGGPFDAYDGTANAYIGANFNNTTGGSGTISNWLLTPVLDFGANATLTFYTRKPATPAGGTDYPDRLEVRLSTNGASTNIGSGAGGVGDFTTVALSVNPDLVPGGYPYAWTQYTVSNLPHNGQGRIAFRYYVTSAGPTGSKSDYIGIDRVRYQAGAPEYQVGGTVGGLAGTGLVLRLNDTADLPVAGNGSFVFPPYVTNGGSYHVVVATQPSSLNQTCSVAHGSGTVGGTINDVQVTCVTNTYSVGGTVTGLAGSGLILHLDNGDDVAVSGNGFVFPNPLPDGTSYVATIGAQPTAPNQTCSLANASGMVAGQDTTSIEVHCVTNTYSVGGTVTGLAGSGLTLHLDNGDDVAVSGSGFAFPNRLPDGTSYVATIGAQPTAPNQTCSLANASGSVTGQDVTSIEVHCVTNTYFVGGLVTGLAGSGLVLHLDNGDGVAVSGGSFVFPTPLADGSAYVASVAAQPTGPKQTCSIASPGGTVAGADVSLGVGCTTNRYTVGGNVIGLDGQVRLRINGGDELTATGDGPFAFPPIDDGMPWVVTLSAPPDGGASTSCRLRGATGTLAGANVDDVLVACDDLFADGFERQD